MLMFIVLETFCKITVIQGNNSLMVGKYGLISGKMLFTRGTTVFGRRHTVGLAKGTEERTSGKPGEFGDK